MMMMVAMVLAIIKSSWWPAMAWRVVDHRLCGRRGMMPPHVDGIVCCAALQVDVKVTWEEGDVDRFVNDIVRDRKVRPCLALPCLESSLCGSRSAGARQAPTPRVRAWMQHAGVGPGARQVE